MTQVTSRFTAGKVKDRENARGDVKKLHSLVKYEQLMRGRDGRKRSWQTLKDTLSPEPRASSTYYCIDQWLLAVDLLQRANVEELCEDPREAEGALVRSVPFLHGRDLPDPEDRWWGGFVEAQMREKEVPLPQRQVDLSPLQAACKGKKTETGDTTSGMTRSTTLPNRRPIQTGDQGTCLAQLFVKCPSFCKHEVSVETVKLMKDKTTARWYCNNCSLIKKKNV